MTADGVLTNKQMKGRVPTISKQELKQGIAALCGKDGARLSLSEVIEALCEALRRNPDAISDMTYSYRICASDTGYTRAFSIKAGVFTDMDELDEADVTVSGSEANLMAVFRRQVSPMSAMLRGKVKVKGSMPALVKFAEFL